MKPLTITPDISKAPWNDLDPDTDTGMLTRIAGVPGGMTGFNFLDRQPAILVAIAMSDGSHVVAQTSWQALYSAVTALEARWGFPR